MFYRVPLYSRMPNRYLPSLMLHAAAQAVRFGRRKRRARFRLGSSASRETDLSKRVTLLAPQGGSKEGTDLNFGH